ncbi:Alpha/Beta hydrolase protein [Chaetomium sp. MPI-SDFR-AT-0129]|nr:Alpha/Beta hydrolase protein [Chaetomium sp. MPI-SDFR-AT-0129]
MGPSIIPAPHPLGVSAIASEQGTGFVLTQDGVRLQYNQSGPLDGQNIVFIHGWRQTAAQWQKQVDYFSNASFRVTTYDMRGHGESEKPTFGYRVSRLAADLNDLLRQLKLTNVTLVGHSMGCSVAWAWWDQYHHDHRPSPVNSLILVDQPATLARNPNWTDEQAAEVSALFLPNQVYDLANDMAGQLVGLLRSMFTDTIPDAEFDWIVSQNRKMSDANAAALLIDHSFRDWRDVFPCIDVPTLVLAGDLSIAPPRGVEWIASQIPGAEHYTFSSEEKGSHFAFWENPDRFNAVVEDFLKRGAPAVEVPGL